MSALGTSNAAATSRHLTLLAEAAQAGAHVVLSGHLHDEVLYEGRVVQERWALAQVLRDRAGLDAVVVGDMAHGLYCVDPNTRERVARALALAPLTPNGEDPPMLGADTARDIARGALALLRQRELAVAVLLEDLDLLVDLGSDQGRRALSLLRRAVREAECVRDREPVSRRNVLVVLGTPASRAASDLAALPGVRTLDAAPPDPAERTAVIAGIARGFYGADVSRDGLANAHEALAKATHGWSVREQEQLRRVSHTRRVAASRPDTLLARMPGREGVNPVERAGVATVTDALEKAIFGQPTALRRLSESIARAERPSGLRPHAEPATRPLMTALMFGPTGVGKTEVARTLARALFGSARAIVRIDCAELKQPHDLARLTGAPPGYVGHDRGGMLSDPLRRRPGSIVLFDEFEKATEALGELLLGILDDGRLTDGRGETVHFGQAIVLLTTNLGASALYREIGDDPPPTTELLETSERIARRLISERRPVLSPDGELEEVDGLGRPELEGLGRPELWSRLQDAVVGFDILRRDALDGIVRKYCQQLQANLGDEHDLRLTIRAGGFVEPIARRLEREGRWDGRSVAQLVRELVEGPLRPQLDGLPPGQIVTAIAGPGGAARIRPRGNGVEEGA